VPDQTLQVAAVYPDGTNVGAYLRRVVPQSNQNGPIGSAVASAVVASGEVTFEDLAEDETYVAAAQVAGNWRYLTFTVDQIPAPTLDSLYDTLVEHIFEEDEVHDTDLAQVRRRLEREFYVEDYYLEDDPLETRDLLAIQRALEAAYDAEEPDGKGLGTVLLHPSKEYVIPTDELVVDLGLASFVGGRGTRIVTTDTEGTLIEVTASINRVVAEPGAVPGTYMGARLGRFANLFLQGPVDVSDTFDFASHLRGLNLAGGSGNLSLATFASLDLRGFDFAVWVGNNVHQIEFEQCYVHHNKFGLFIPHDATNTGERISVRGGASDNNCVSIWNGLVSCDIQVLHHSFDYLPAGPQQINAFPFLGLPGGDLKKAHVVCAGGTVTLHGCHIEDDDDYDHWFRVYAAGGDLPNKRSRLRIGGGTRMQVEGNKQTAPFYCDSNLGSGGGIVFDGVSMRVTSNLGLLMPTLVKGGGPVHVTKGGILYEPLAGQADGSVAGRQLRHPPITERLSPIDGSFDLASPRDLEGWDLTYSTTPADQPTLDTAQKFSGTKSLKFAASVNGRIPAAALALPVEPGDTLLSSFRFRWNGWQAGSDGGRFSVVVYWLRADGLGTVVFVDFPIDLESEVAAIPGVEADWMIHHTVPVVAPQGAEKAVVVFADLDATHGWPITVERWIDDVVVNVI
jgi:hypothetical protein